MEQLGRQGGAGGEQGGAVGQGCGSEGRGRWVGCCGLGAGGRLIRNRSK